MEAGLACAHYSRSPMETGAPPRRPFEVYTLSHAVCGRGWTSLSEAG